MTLLTGLQSPENPHYSLLFLSPKHRHVPLPKKQGKFYYIQGRSASRYCSCFASIVKKENKATTGKHSLLRASLARRAAILTLNWLHRKCSPNFGPFCGLHNPINHCLPLHQAAYAGCMHDHCPSRGWTHNTQGRSKGSRQSPPLGKCLGWSAQKFQSPHHYFAQWDDGWKSARHSAKEQFCKENTANSLCSWLTHASGLLSHHPLN